MYLHMIHDKAWLLGNVIMLKNFYLYLSFTSWAHGSPGKKCAIHSDSPRPRSWNKPCPCIRLNKITILLPINLQSMDIQIKTVTMLLFVSTYIVAVSPLWNFTKLIWPYICAHMTCSSKPSEPVTDIISCISCILSTKCIQHSEVMD